MLKTKPDAEKAFERISAWLAHEIVDRVSIPKMGMKNVTAKENNKIIWKEGSYVDEVKGICGGSECADRVTFDVGSGFYVFHILGS